MLNSASQDLFPSVTECECQCWLTGWTSFLPGYSGQSDGLFVFTVLGTVLILFLGLLAHKCCDDHISLPFPSSLVTLSATLVEVSQLGRHVVREFACVYV